MRIVSEEDVRKFADRLLKQEETNPAVHYYGLFRAGEMVGGTGIYRFEMNLLGARAKAGGIGQLAIDLLRKKEKAARDMMLASLRHFRGQGASLVALYPFRPDFYVKMGFGYGTKMNRYKLKPGDFPKGPSKQHVVYLTKDDAREVHACYMRYFERTHGMMGALPEVEHLFDSPRIRVVGCKREGAVTGYMTFTFRPDEKGVFIVNDMQIRELVYDGRDDLLELTTFLNTQADEIRRVEVYTQDEFFHFLPFDPRDGSDDLIPSVYHVTNSQGVGLMYRVVDVKEVLMGVAAFSSLLVGGVDFATLNRYGLASMSDERYVEAVQQVFKAPKPICLTDF